jgi:hypothetical protein
MTPGLELSDPSSTSLKEIVNMPPEEATVSRKGD